MAHVKAGGTSKNNHNSPGQRLGVKVYGGQKVSTGDVIIRQVGMNKRPGKGTFLSRNFTIHAAKDGVVKYQPRRIRKYTGKTTLRTEVTVI